jgi:hypothetical protein
MSGVSPTKWYVAFWTASMLVSWGIGLGVIWQLHRLIAVLTQFLNKQ